MNEVVIVDDDVLILECMKKYFERMKCECKTFPYVDEAIQHLDHRVKPYDAYFLDVGAHLYDSRYNLFNYVKDIFDDVENFYFMSGSCEGENIRQVKILTPSFIFKPNMFQALKDISIKLDFKEKEEYDLIKDIRSRLKLE